MKNYDVNKQTEFFVNDLIWESPTKINDFGFETQYLAKMKAVSYNADNTSKFKNENKNYEAYGAVGLSAKLPILKENKVKSFRDYFTPKFLLRYSPGHMRSIDDNYKLKYDDVFNIDRINLIDTLESGLSASLGFEYTKNKVLNNFNLFCLAPPRKTMQIHSEIIPKKLYLDPKRNILMNMSSFGYVRTCQGQSRRHVRTCLDLPGPVQEDKYLLQTTGNTFFSKH